MKHSIALLLLVTLFIVPARAQKKPQADRTTDDAHALTELEMKWISALMKSDTAALDAIFADGYVDTDEHSQRSDKLGVLSVLKSGDLKMESIKLSDMKVYVYGDAAVVIGSAAQAGNFQGRAVAPKIIFTDTFVKQKGKWRAVASHRSPVEQ
jgi:ketosteroid isomerase-like protein